MNEPDPHALLSYISTSPPTTGTLGFGRIGIGSSERMSGCPDVPWMAVSFYG